MKNKTVFFCSECGNETAKWYGKCPACGAWNTLVEETSVTRPAKAAKGVRAESAAAEPEQVPMRLGEIDTTSQLRSKTGIAEFDRVLGGGMVAGSLILVGGDPGIGKSTLLLQVCAGLSGQSLPGIGADADSAGAPKILYVSGEESVRQLKLRADRLGVQAEQLYLVSQTNLEHIHNSIDQIGADIVIIDSIQTMYTSALTSAPGSVSQVREVTMQLMRRAKQDGITVFVVGHVTKDGGIAGPKVLEHMVDCVLYFEGERHQNYRILRSVKNRFGSTNEIGVFEMHETGLVGVDNPSGVLLAERAREAAGSCVICALEGSRPVLAEVQALVCPTSSPAPRRSVNGLDFNRAAMVMAVLERRAGMKLYNQDCYLNVAGGLRIDEPASDLGIALAIASSLRGFCIAPDLAVIGEVGLTGEVRSINQAQKRAAEIEKLGFRRLLLPKSSLASMQSYRGSIELVPVRNVLEALAAVR